MPRQVIKEITARILAARRGSPLRVGIDGIDAAGKTFLADEIASDLSERGYPVLRATIDSFHNPRQVRYQRGSYSPEGYYYDSFNYERLIQCLLEPLEPQGDRTCHLEAFDFKTDTELCSEELRATNNHILVFDGVFLFRPEIRRYWDLKIWVDVAFETSLNRALERDLDLLGDRQAIQERYQKRYIPGQKIYIASENPRQQADIVIDNNDYTQPFITFRRSASPC